jgi:hypothetical protein
MAALATAAGEACPRLPSGSRPAELASVVGRAAPSEGRDNSYPRAGGEEKLKHGIDETHQAPQCGIDENFSLLSLSSFVQKADVVPYLMCMKPFIKLH